MNTRIKQLADRAKEQSEQFNSIRHKLTDEEWEEIYNEKFARLIVLECVTAVMDGTKEGDHYAQRIEQHFDNGPGGILTFRS
jgi:hypothetical protein